MSWLFWNRNHRNSAICIITSSWNGSARMLPKESGFCISIWYLTLCTAIVGHLFFSRVVRRYVVQSNYQALLENQFSSKNSRLVYSSYLSSRRRERWHDPDNHYLYDEKCWVGPLNLAFDSSSFRDQRSSKRRDEEIVIVPQYVCLCQQSCRRASKYTIAGTGSSIWPKSIGTSSHWTVSCPFLSGWNRPYATCCTYSSPLVAESRGYRTLSENTWSDLSVNIPLWNS
jgi:hypothetical protein